ncbi:serine hydrolase [Spongiactinospora gelatinilytica]|uniref:Serine hydrolase n=1 Tax=Spongiactinospora gelatinilytica TaxID=2666298 RepID=A0A2W2HQM0_9ACTN|nr:serine hydrolase domain-containing protein [Spongiactinospora gelatinilytica]PZG52078.1 serine hydrolase [Spongiactinospora gelatinilytica]
MTSAEAHPSRRVALGLLGAVPLTAGGVTAFAEPAAAEESAGNGGIPGDVRPGGAYDRFLKKLADEDGFSGTVLIKYHERTVLSRSYGMADKERAIPNGARTIFNLASASKPFTALSILQLVQANRLKLTDKIGDHLDGYPAETARHVMIHHLLTHTSGLESNVHLPDRITNSVQEERALREMVHRAAKPVFTPGGDHAYSSVGMSILGEIVEKVGGGGSFHEYVAENVFRRAGMTDSAYYTRPDWLNNERIAHPYMWQEDGPRVDAVRNLDKGAVLNGGKGTNAARAWIGSGGGGGFSTAPDLAAFARALLNGRLLDPALTELFLSPKYPTTPPGGGERPGQGFSAYGVVTSLIGGRFLAGHGGGIGGGNTNWTIYRDRGWMGIILCNYDLDIQSIITRERTAILGL